MMSCANKNSLLIAFAVFKHMCERLSDLRKEIAIFAERKSSKNHSSAFSASSPCVNNRRRRNKKKKPHNPIFEPREDGSMARPQSTSGRRAQKNRANALEMTKGDGRRPLCLRRARRCQSKSIILFVRGENMYYWHLQIRRLGKWCRECWKEIKRRKKIHAGLAIMRFSAEFFIFFLRVPVLAHFRRLLAAEIESGSGNEKKKIKIPTNSLAFY